MTVVAEAKSSLLHIQKELILDLCQNNRAFLSKYLESLSIKALILTDKIKFMSLKTIRDKIVEFLTYEYHIQNRKIIKLDMSKKN